MDGPNPSICIRQNNIETKRHRIKRHAKKIRDRTNRNTQLVYCTSPVVLSHLSFVQCASVRLQLVVGLWWHGNRFLPAVWDICIEARRPLISDIELAAECARQAWPIVSACHRLTCVATSVCLPAACLLWRLCVFYYAESRVIDQRRFVSKASVNHFTPVNSWLVCRIGKDVSRFCQNKRLRLRLAFRA